MVRVFLKGGVWKNSEDEVLKAAVQKYGKQQWARVASLLNRKTAKQAKARWYEWLDPAIKKTEWSRAEEEKLLHLAKLLPAQWKTIGPMVGRTAAQCQEHYERLLDQAAAAASGGSKEEGGGGGVGSASAGDELRGETHLLRAGQIDSHPETKPAKPDPIDMDEDELEMLQEARARLANTLGKKAKRKQREKMLAQAKRLSDLQKRRELKAAGLLASAARKKSKRKDEIDLGIEIPFYKPAPAGFHDTSTEQQKSFRIQQDRSRQVDLHQINEARYRSRDHDEAVAQKKEERRMQLLEKMNASYQKEKDLQEEALKMASSAMRSRGSLQLPDPTVTDAELEEMAKNYSRDQRQQQQLLLMGQEGATGGPTLALLGDDGRDQAHPTPMRTPFPNAMSASVAGGTLKSSAITTQQSRAGSSSTVHRRDLVREANQLRRLERGATPLLAASVSGGMRDGRLDDEDDDVEDQFHGDERDFANDGEEDDRKMPARSVGGGGDDAASVGASTWATSANTIRELARQERRAAKRARQELERALASLPEPQYEYELAAPAPAGAESDDDRIGVVSTVTDDLDQADVEAAEREERMRQAEKRYQERSSVLKRPNLPRPVRPPPRGVASGTADGPNPPTITAAFDLIQQEMVNLIKHDNYKYSVASTDHEKSKKKRKRKDGSDAPALVVEEVEVPNTLMVIAEADLERASTLIDAELEGLMSDKVEEILRQDTNQEVSSPEEAIAVLCDRAIAASRDGAESMMYTEEGWVESPTQEDVVSSLKLEFDGLRQATEALRKKNDKIEAKLKVMNGGYAKIDDRCTQEMRQTIDAIKNARIELSVYRMLQSQEQRGGSERVEQLQEDVKRLQSLEAELQKQYGDLMVERRRRIALANASVRQS